MFCIETATVTGPVYESWPPESYFYRTYCKDIDASAGYEACQAILNRLARNLFRGPVSDSEMQQFYKLAERVCPRPKHFLRSAGGYSRDVMFPEVPV